MKKAVLLMVALLVLTACAKTVTMTQEGAAGSTKEKYVANEPVAQEAQKPDVDKLTSAGLDCLKLGVRVCQPVNFQNAKVGDTVGFAFGMTNLLAVPKNFSIKATFVRVQQKTDASSITEDKDFMNKWLEPNVFEKYFELQPNQKFSKPILINVKDLIADGEKTPPGTYVFQIQAQTYDDGFYDNYEAGPMVSVRVQ